MNFFAAHGVGCKPVPTRPNERTPDFVIELAEPVICEVKQIDANEADRKELQEALKNAKLPKHERSAVGGFVPNRIRRIFSKMSAQLKQASMSGTPTLLAIYDATPFQSYSQDLDILQGMFGPFLINVWDDESGETRHSETYHGLDRGLTKEQNTSVSAVGILRGGPEASTLSFTLFHNPHARVPLNRNLFDRLPVAHR